MSRWQRLPFVLLILWASCSSHRSNSLRMFLEILVA